VFALAEYVGVPEEIRRRTPTMDTSSLPQTQEAHYFAMPYEQMDLCLMRGTTICHLSSWRQYLA
jgi:NAD+ synthase